MAGYVFIGALAAFGLMCAVWIGCGFFLPDSRSGMLILSGPMDETEISTARRWLWLREMGLLYGTIVAVEETLETEERIWLECRGFEICSRAEIAERLGIGEDRIDTGIGDTAGRDQRGGISEL